MVKRYVMVRMPREAYEGFVMTKKQMEANIKMWTGKDKKIRMSNVYRVVAKAKKEIPEVNVIRLVKKKKGATNWY